MALLLAALPGFAHAQGGPPFRTDDPETPGNKHWEINFGFVGARNPAAGTYQVPDFDFNYGLGDRIQLKYEIPIAIEETRPRDATSTQPPVRGTVLGGLGESLLGVKWRFYELQPLFHVQPIDALHVHFVAATALRVGWEITAKRYGVALFWKRLPVWSIA